MLLRGGNIAELPLRLKIYRFLVEGYARSHIAKLLKISPGTVAYHVEQLEKEEYIRRVPGSKSPILYTKGKNAYKLDRKIKQILGGEEDRGGWLIVRTATPASVHHNGFKFKILKPADRQPPWQKQWEASGVQCKEFTIKQPNGGKWDQAIRIREVRGKKDASIIIWLPEYKVSSKDELEYILKARVEWAQNIANWLQKEFGYRLGIIEEYEPHIAFQIEKKYAEAAIKLGIRSEHFRFDRTPKPGLETNNAKKAIEALTVFEAAGEILNKVSILEKHINKNSENSKIIEKSIKEIYLNLQNLTNATATLANFFAELLIKAKEMPADAAPKPDERRDVV